MAIATSNMIVKDRVKNNQDLESGVRWNVAVWRISWV